VRKKAKTSEALERYKVLFENFMGQKVYPILEQEEKQRKELEAREAQRKEEKREKGKQKKFRATELKDKIKVINHAETEEPDSRDAVTRFLDSY